MSPGASETDSDSVADTVDEQKHEEMYYCACRIQAGDAGGSGICIYSDRRENGYAHTLVLTNHHVVDDLISVEEQWDPTLQEERKQEVTETATVEFFQYNDYSKAVGTQAYQADVVAWDHQDRRDIALLELRETEATMDHVAGMLPYDQRESIYMFDQVYAVGAALGHPVFQTPGEVTNAQIEMGQQTYIGTNSSLSFGSSGGGLFKQGADGHYYMIGLPARVSMQGFGSVANHIGFAVPVDEIYDFLDENHVQYIWQDDVTIAECEQKRADKRAPDQD
jgi:S1-C subfamily serine protease